MPVGSVAYLAMVLAAYALFIVVLGTVWLRQALGGRAPAKVERPTPRHGTAAEPDLRRAA